MTYRSGEDTVAFVDGIVHLETQQASHGIDLTASRVFRLTGGGHLDFGGSEFAAAPREEVEAVLADPEDTYGWWELDQGRYIVRYNESLNLDGRAVALLEPLDRLLQAGADHSPRHVTNSHDPLETLLTVGPHGLRLKENCRVSRLLVRG